MIREKRGLNTALSEFSKALIEKKNGKEEVSKYKNVFSVVAAGTPLCCCTKANKKRRLENEKVEKKNGKKRTFALN